MLGLGLAQAIVTLSAPAMEQHLGRTVPGGVGALAIGSEALAGAVLIGLLVTGLCCAVQLWAVSPESWTAGPGTWLGEDLIHVPHPRGDRNAFNRVPVVPAVSGRFRRSSPRCRAEPARSRSCPRR